MSYVARLYLRLLKISIIWRFNWAHKPLCDQYKADVLKIGSLYLCRSCSFLYLAIFATACLVALYPIFFRDFSHILLIALSATTLPLSHPAIYKKLYRPIRDILRFSLGSMIVMNLTAIAHGHFLVTSVLIITSLFFWRYYYAKRASRKIERCESCPDYTENSICSGYAFQAEQIRKYEDEATEYLLKIGYVPKSLSNRK